MCHVLRMPTARVGLHFDQWRVCRACGNGAAGARVRACGCLCGCCVWVSVCSPDSRLHATQACTEVPPTCKDTGCPTPPGVDRAGVGLRSLPCPNALPPLVLYAARPVGYTGTNSGTGQRGEQAPIAGWSAVFVVAACMPAAILAYTLGELHFSAERAGEPLTRMRPRAGWLVVQAVGATAGIDGARRSEPSAGRGAAGMAASRGKGTCHKAKATHP